MTSNVPPGREEIYAAMRVDYEVFGLGRKKLGHKYLIPVATIADQIRKGGWVRYVGDEEPFVTPEDEATLLRGLRRVGHNPPLPLPTDPKPRNGRPPAAYTQGVDGDGSSEDNVINFPRGQMVPPMRPPPTEVQRIVVAIPQLPEYGPEKKSQIRTTLGAIKAMMTIEQVQVLEEHEGILRRYSHLMKTFLDPLSVLDVTGLGPDEIKDHAAATQVLALKQLLPTERDTLAGAIKQLTESMIRSMEMKRKILGLHEIRAGTSRVGRENPDDLVEQAGTAELGQVKVAGGGAPAIGAMGTGELRQVARAMELIQRRQQLVQEAPKPPAPDPIDFLMDDGPDPTDDPPDEAAPAERQPAASDSFAHFPED